MDTLLLTKMCVLVYIVLSPFLSHKWLKKVNFTSVKVLLLLIIVIVSFIDFQLALLLTIAFLILVIQLNNDELHTSKQNVQNEQNVPVFQVLQEKNPVKVTQEREQLVRGDSLFPMPSVAEKFEEKKMETPQTMVDFPKPYCKGFGPINPYLISESAFLYSTDNRTKPYEEYIKMLSPESALEDIQTNQVF